MIFIQETAVEFIYVDHIGTSESGIHVLKRLRHFPRGMRVKKVKCGLFFFKISFSACLSKLPFQCLINSRSRS